MSDEDDDALTWAGGESDSSYVANPEPVRPLRAPKRATRAGKARPEILASAGEHGDDATEPAMGSAELLGLGVLGGIYLLYTAGWIISFRRLLYVSTSALDEAGFHAQQILGIAAPAIWFASTFWLTRGGKPWLRLVWLVVGAVLLVPWSFVMGI